MTINATDIKLLESERMNDNPDGGGRRTSHVIPDGVPGNIFPKVSRLDGVYGRVNLRKAYGAVITANVDTYAGSHFIITDAPDNSKIHVVLFSTNSDFDTRAAARDRIESYVVAGPESRLTLYGRQLVGQKAVLMYQRTEEILPEVGTVFCLSKETGDVVNYQQYVKVSEVAYEDRTFTDGNGDFTRRVITIKIDGPLRFEFRGPDEPARVSNVLRPSKVRSTTVADASNYFGIAKLITAGHVGDLDIKLDSVYTQLVPTTQREVPISLANIAEGLQLIPSGGSKLSAESSNFPERYYAGSAVVPGSFTYTYTIFGGTNTLTDTNVDGVVEIDGVPTEGASIDYPSGLVSVPGFVALATTGLQWDYAVAVSTPTYSSSTKISLANRGTVFSEVLEPAPTPGTVIVDFRALGRWYRLRDDVSGSGQLSGASPAEGVGSVNYETGALVLTLGALPDVDSSIIKIWASGIHYEKKTTDAAPYLEQQCQLTNVPVAPGTIHIDFHVYDNDSAAETAKTASDAGGTGNITGSSGSGVTGTVNYMTGLVTLRYSLVWPVAGSTVTISYDGKHLTDPDDPVTPTKTYNLAYADPTTLVDTNVAPNSVIVNRQYTCSPQGFYGLTFGMLAQITDDGAGNMVIKAGNGPIYRNGWQYVPGAPTPGPSGNTILSSQTVGTINYTTGVIDWNGATVVGHFDSLLTSKPFDGGPQYVVADVDFSQITSGSNSQSNVYYVAAGAATTTSDFDQTFNFVDNPLLLDTLRTSGDTVVPGSVRLMFKDRLNAYNTYYEMTDRNGKIVWERDPRSNAATEIGAINYRTGVVSIKSWSNDQRGPHEVRIVSLVVERALFDVSQVDFRTAGSPVRPASFYIQATSEDGVLCTAQADVNGVITGTHARGTINQTMGTVHVEWGDMVAKAGHELEDWYDPANVVGANVWKPRGILPATIRYSAVVITSLPLNAELLGLDPVRLPSDGRVPMARPGDVGVIHNTKSYNFTAVAGSTFNVGRTNLSSLWLIDQNKKRVSADLFLADLAAGTFQMADPMVLTGYTTPLIARHRIEEMTLLTDARIDGGVSLAAPLAKEYDNSDTYLSTALLFSDLAAHVSDVFDQQTWTGVWSNDLIGDQANAQFNDIDYPIEVLNNGAFTERWRIQFTSSTAFQVIGENFGVIATGTTASDVQVNSILTGLPYFLIRHQGWGSGWATGNQLRFNTFGATAPVWIVRTILSGASLEGDSFDIQFRGDVDA